MFPEDLLSRGFVHSCATHGASVTVAYHGKHVAAKVG